MKKKLYIVTDGYPYIQAEMPFLLPELEVTYRDFVIKLLCSVSHKKRIFKPPYGIPSYSFPGIRPVQATTAQILERCMENKKCREEVFRNSSGEPQNEVAIAACQFLYYADELRKYMGTLGFFDDIPHSIYYSYWYSVGTLAFVLEKERQPEMKIVTRIHGYDLYNERRPYGQMFKTYMDPYIDLIGFISSLGRNYYAEHFSTKPSEAFNVYYLGVPDRGLGKAEPNGALNLLSCSNLIPLKRVERIAEAVSLLSGPVNWCHIGGGSEQEPLRTLCQKLFAGKKNITWTFAGQVLNEQVACYYQKNPVDLFLSASQTEGLPVSMMEAFSFGVPVIAPEVGGIPEIVNERSGFLLSADPSPEEIANAIRKWQNLSDEEKQTLRRNARQTWQETFDAKKNHERFSQDLQALFKNKKRGSFSEIQGKIESGQLQEALDMLTELPDAQRDTFEAQNYLGVIAYETGQYPEAERFIGRALHFCPDDMECLYNMVLVQQALGNQAKAGEFLLRCMELPGASALPLEQIQPERRPAVDLRDKNIAPDISELSNYKQLEQMVRTGNGNVAIFSMPPVRSIKGRLEILSVLCENNAVLHVGCTDHLPLIQEKMARGTWLHGVLTRKCSRLLGVDINKTAIKVLSEKGIHNIAYADITEPDNPQITLHHWDYILFAEMLEHLDDPAGFLKKVKQNYGRCADAVIVTVPNILGMEYLSFALNNGEERINPDHRYWFTPYTLWKVLSDAELTVVSLFTCAHEGSEQMLDQEIVRKHPILQDNLVAVCKF